MMTTIDEKGYIEIIHLAINLLLLVGLLYCWRLYRVDALRQRLFAARDELFNYAASGAISFRDPAYTELREVMNGMIRFAYRITFMRLCFSMLLLQVRPFANIDARSPYLTWRKRLDSLPAPARTRLVKAHNEMGVLVVRHIVSGSPLLWVLLGALLLRLALRGAYKRVLETFTASIQPGLDLIEAQALASRRAAA